MMLHAVATVAALAGIVLTAGSNPILALGIGLLVFAAVLMLNDFTDRLQRIEQSLGEVAAQVDAATLHERLARERPSAEPPPPSSVNGPPAA
jgi:hypothetical protein